MMPSKKKSLVRWVKDKGPGRKVARTEERDYMVVEERA